MRTINYEVNEFQTPITEDLLSEYPDEVVEWFWDAINSIDAIRWLIDPKRPRAKDLSRDNKGRIIVDIAHPHIIEDADYFRQPALHYMKHGCYTFLKPSKNPHSEYRKYWDEEIRRCREGYVRESDGEWVPGKLYWFLNYNPMMVNKTIEGKKKAVRDEGFPFFFEGIYLRFHYLWQAREAGKHAIELAKRGCGKSYSLASIMTGNLILGESEASKKRVTTVLTAYEKEYLKDDKDGTFSKFKPSLNFIRSNTPFPRLMLKNSPNEMSWQMGYKDENGIERGSFNQVLGVSAKDNPDKLRGKRGWILYEEMGTFKGLLPLYDTTRKSVEDGDYTFATQYLVGTASEKESDFSSAKTLLYGTEGYNIYSVPNVYDKKNQGKPRFGFFFAAYMNRAGCYNKDGVSDVVKALLQVFTARYKAKYSADPKSVLRVIAEDPITPAEAIIKVKDAFFPVSQLNERILQLDSSPRIYDDVYVGNLVLSSNGEVTFKPSSDVPIRKYGVDNSTQGAIEIYAMPEKNREGKVYSNRYIIGHDPVDNDQADSHSLSSTFVLDLFTDRIVAEFTGRKPFANDNYEIVRLLCLFYNGKCLFEAHAYSEKVPTPEGFKLWKDIKIGDTLFSPTKGTVKVIDIPVDTYMPIYKVTLQDGRVITASDRHLWSVYYRNEKTPRLMNTEQMMKYKLKNKYGQHTLFIPEGNPVNYEYKELPIDPYTMGLILAEGSIRGSHCTKNNIQISSSKEDMEFYKTEIPYECKFIGSKGFSWHVKIPKCKQIMADLKLLNTNSHTKFIPNIYMYSNIVQRMQLLKGLMDGDGFASSKGASIFATSSLQLANDVMSLARSLGIKAWMQNTSNGAFRVCLASIYKIFKLPRKIVEQHVYSPYSKGSKASGILYKTAIEKIEFSHYEMGKCVTVDSDDGLYLINDYVITHNSNKKGIYAYFQMMSCTHLLADTPEYLREKELVKYSAFGSNRKGVSATAAVNNYANGLIRDWLLKPVPMMIKNEEGESQEMIPMLYTLKSRALLEELVAFTPELNVDRIRALGMVMLYREEKLILYRGDLSADREEKANSSYLGNDPFFVKNYRTK